MERLLCPRHYLHFQAERDLGEELGQPFCFRAEKTDGQRGEVTFPGPLIGRGELCQLCCARGVVRSQVYPLHVPSPAAHPVIILG